IPQPRRVQPLSPGAACHDGDIADILADLRYGDTGQEKLQLLGGLGRGEADEIETILIQDEAEYGRAIAPIAVGMPHIRHAPHDVEGLLGDAVELCWIGSHDPEL